MDEELKRWFREEFIEIQGYRFGPHETSTDYVKQECTWTCYGCDATAITSWPKWGEPDMKHKPGCKYLKFLELGGEVKGADERS